MKPRPSKSIAVVPEAWSWRSIGTIAVVAFVARGLYWFEMRDAPVFQVVWSDAKSYDAWAREIAAGDWLGSQVFYQAPLYPYFLGIVYSLFGPHTAVVRFVQMLLGTLSCVFLGTAGARFLSPRAGLIAGLMLACYPTALFFDLLIQKTVLDGLFLTAALALLGGLLDRPLRPAAWFGLGATLGCFALTRENSLLMVPLLAAWGIIRIRREDPRPAIVCRNVGALILGATCLLFPVALRNFVVGGEWHLTTSQFGPNFYIGNGPHADGTYVALRPGRGDPIYERTDAVELAEQALGRSLTSRDVSEYWTDQALTFIRENPAAWLRLMGLKTLLTLNGTEMADADDPTTFAVWSWTLRLLYAIFHFGVLLPAAIFGMWVTRGEFRRLAVLYLLLIAYAAAVILFYVFARYRYPLAPICMLFAAGGVAAMFDPKVIARRKELFLGAAMGVAAAVIANWPLGVRGAALALTYFNLGTAELEKKDWRQARRYYEQALEADPNMFNAHGNLGNVLARLGDNDGAIAHYRRAVELSPDYADVHNNLYAS